MREDRTSDAELEAQIQCPVARCIAGWMGAAMGADSLHPNATAVASREGGPLNCNNGNVLPGQRESHERSSSRRYLL